MDPAAESSPGPDALDAWFTPGRFAALLATLTCVFREFGNFAYPLAFYQRAAFWPGELPLSWSLAVFCLLHLWFGGLGMYFLAPRWTGRAQPAAVADVA